MADVSFANEIVNATPDQLLILERDAGHSHRFTAVDHLAADAITTALAGNKVFQIRHGIRGIKNADTLRLIPVADRSFVNQTFALPGQQARGAWLLPEHVSLKVGSTNLPSYIRHHPWHAITMAADDVARVQTASTADSMVAWALLIPLFDTLLAPVTTRAAGSTASPDEQQQTWSSILQSYQHLGLQNEQALAVFAYRGGWSTLDRAAQSDARLALLDALARHNPLQIASRYRAKRVQALAAATMKKARRGTPLARQVLTRPLQPVLSAYFGGDWLSFLDYLGVQPNSNEEIVTALPQPKLYVGGSTKAATVAAEHGLPIGEVHAMLAAFMGQQTSVSPVEQRLGVLSGWWAQFDAIHTRHTAGMASLSGLLEEGFVDPEMGPTQPLYRELLTADLVTKIDQLWDGTTLPRWPEVIVSEPFPHRIMAETFGPAGTFWHNVALTAWYVCEGPYSRTSLTELKAYHERDLAVLAEAGTPIHPSLFDELVHAEQRLGPLQSLESNAYELQLPDGRIGVRFSGGGQRRDGFEILRDVITRHRQGWARRYLTDYLRHRWQQQLSTVARELHRHIAVKSKPPTFRQFAKFATNAANHWFNGDLAGLYTAIGEKAPVTPRRIDLLPTSTHHFVHAVYTALGGQRYSNDLRITDYPTADRFRQISRLASGSLYYLQLSEALGRNPEQSEFRAGRYEWEWATNLDQGWPRFQAAIEMALRDAAGP
ncbi:hypothetical protein AB0M43_34795 [Longispora sp. NPDC051575]|uniref:hypothetical protein n=1 Tax=Longispora sp. NPDC051575 TaxID=3154943 RepID=UPI00341D2CE9